MYYVGMTRTYVYSSQYKYLGLYSIAEAMMRLMNTAGRTGEKKTENSLSFIIRSAVAII